MLRAFSVCWVDDPGDLVPADVATELFLKWEKSSVLISGKYIAHQNAVFCAFIHIFLTPKWWYIAFLCSAQRKY